VAEEEGDESHNGFGQPAGEHQAVFVLTVTKAERPAWCELQARLAFLCHDLSGRCFRVKTLETADTTRLVLAINLEKTFFSLLSTS
jgi:hypothetical protein